MYPRHYFSEKDDLEHRLEKVVSVTYQPHVCGWFYESSTGTFECDKNIYLCVIEYHHWVPDKERYAFSGSKLEYWSADSTGYFDCNEGISNLCGYTFHQTELTEDQKKAWKEEYQVKGLREKAEEKQKREERDAKLSKLSQFKARADGGGN